jgi:hypothetical protein
MAKHPEKTVEQVRQALAGVMAVRIDALERLVQEAHESPAKQKDDPPEQFAVSRQCLRMFWHFRCNLEAVKEPLR